MIVTYRVNTETEEGQYEKVVLDNATNMLCVLQQLENELRQMVKYGQTKYDISSEEAQKFRTMLFEAIAENEVSIEL